MKISNCWTALPMVVLVGVVIGVVVVVVSVAGLLAMKCIKEDWWRLDIFLKYLNSCYYLNC